MNNKLTKVEILYVPVNINDELPTVSQGYFTLWKEDNILGTHLFVEKFIDNDDDVTEMAQPSHWLKEQNNKYLLSEEDIENIICKAVELAREGIVVHRISEWETEKEFDYNDSQIINEILNK